MKRIGFLFLLFSLLLTPTAYSRTLELKSWQIWDFSYNGIHEVCCAVSVKDGEIPVTGLSIEDFTITETLVDEYGMSCQRPKLLRSREKTSLVALDSGKVQYLPRKSIWSS